MEYAYSYITYLPSDFKAEQAVQIYHYSNLQINNEYT